MTLEFGNFTYFLDFFVVPIVFQVPHLLCDLSNMFKILDTDLWFSLKHKLLLPRKGNEKSPLFFYLKKSSFLRIPTVIPLNTLISALYFHPPTILSPTGVAPISCLLFFNEPLSPVSAAPMCTVVGLLGGSLKTHKWLRPPKEWFSPSPATANCQKPLSEGEAWWSSTLSRTEFWLAWSCRGFVMSSTPPVSL